MAKKGGTEFFQVDGRKLEEKYDWIAAIVLYENAFTAALNQNDFFKAATIYERIGYCSHRAAMQAKDQQAFRTRMLQVIDAYSRAGELFEKDENLEKLAKNYHCKAMTAYASSRLRSDYASRKNLLEECCKLEKETLKLYEDLGDQLNSAKTYNELNTCLLECLDIEWDRQIREKTLRTALSDGEKAIGILSELEGEHELARAYCLSSGLYHTAALGLELEKKSEFAQKALNYSEKAVKLSKKIGDHFLLGISSIWLGSTIGDFTANQESAKKHFENALRCGMRTKDNYLIGRASYLMAHLTCWNMLIEEDPKKKRKESKVCREYSEEAIYRFSSIFRDNEIASSYYEIAESYSVLAMSGETHPEKKPILLRKSIEAGRKGLAYARRSGSISATWFVLHPLSKSLFYLSILEKGEVVKKRLLQESLRYRKENIKALTWAMPYYFWNHGVYHNYLALIQAELAELERNEKQKVRFYEEAIKSAEKCVALCLKSETLSNEQYVALGRYYFDLGGILNHLYLVTGKPELLVRLSEAFNGAVKAYKKVDMSNLVAESYWQLASIYDKMRNYTESADSFELAHENYILAAKKVPSLRDFYLSHASYMEGWSEIEKARHHHSEQDYSSARQHFEIAADVHRSLKQWSYLSSNYLAWAAVEQAEESSRREETEETIKAFENATDLFVETKKSLQKQVDIIEDANEKRMAIDMIKATDLRREYCIARLALEKAKSLDKKGDHRLSAEKYASVANAFERLGQAVESDQERKEIKLISILANAWQKMAEAEAEQSPQHYAEASRLFETAKNLALGEKMKALVLGHSRFCMALQAGAKFADTRDMLEYTRAMQYLESANGYYLKANFQNASDYVKATRFLFDAYVHLGNAARETDLEKKGRIYLVAEKILQASVDSYTKAGNPSGREQALKLLDTAREQREVSISLVKVLHAPIVTSTTSFTAPTPTSENAVGLERFEHAEVNANLILSRRELKVGESLDLEIELANAGKGQALLTQIEEAVPEGFEVTRKPELYRLEGCNINMKGKRLDPLKAEEVRLSLKSRRKGSFTLRPRILYVDENGNAKSHQPEPVTITVKELGIRGWITGDT